ncbi:MAG TPA: hypothetical protein VJV75_04555 [Candidatus Polarisedimenticolia bacterium]|nr:hypothetical protein [Candidatus Polarisedimenticolia bacterium]
MNAPHLRLVSETRAPGVYGSFEIRRRRMDAEIDRMRDEDRRVRRGIALGVLIGGVLLWPTVIAFGWVVVQVARW